jgi:hypothetical protein
VLDLTGPADPPEGFELRLGDAGVTKVTADGKDVPRSAGGTYLLPGRTRRAEIALPTGKPKAD